MNIHFDAPRYHNRIIVPDVLYLAGFLIFNMTLMIQWTKRCAETRPEFLTYSDWKNSDVYLCIPLSVSTVTSEILEGMFFLVNQANMQSTGTLLHTRNHYFHAVVIGIWSQKGNVIQNLLIKSNLFQSVTSYCTILVKRNATLN